MRGLLLKPASEKARTLETEPSFPLCNGHIIRNSSTTAGNILSEETSLQIPISPRKASRWRKGSVFLRIWNIYAYKPPSEVWCPSSNSWLLSFLFSNYMARNARKAMFNAGYIQVKRGVNTLVSLPENFIFLLAQTCWFFLPFWGKGTAVANIRDTPQSQVAVCYSRNHSRVTAQHGEVTLKISMCWFDSNYSSSESCSPFKSFTFFHLKDLLPTSLS